MQTRIQKVFLLDSCTCIACKIISIQVIWLAFCFIDCGILYNALRKFQKELVFYNI
jgi:hypothetical protein